MINSKKIQKIGMVIYLLITVIFLSVGCSSVADHSLESATLIFTNGLVIDGTGADPIPEGLVAVSGNQILGVGQADQFKIPDDVEVIDVRGGTIMPGIFNAHMHFASSAATRRNQFLLDGVTSVCDLGVPLSSMDEYEQESTQAGPAARGFKAGPMITVPDGYPRPFGIDLCYEIEGEDQAANAVEDLQKRGADYIKVALEPGFTPDESFPVLDIQELSSIVRAAHAHGLLVRVHLTNATLLEIALDADVDVIEHVPMPFFEKEIISMVDESGNFKIPPDYKTKLDQMIDQGIVLVPTLDVLNELPKFAKEINYVVNYYHDSGGVIALGNDYGALEIDPGMPLQEMEYLCAAGLSPMEVIEAATRHAAYVCGQGDQLGTLEEGKLADLIVVDGNPLDDLQVMDSVLYVVKDGEIALSPEQEDQ